MNIDRFAHPDLKIPTAIGIGLGLAIGLGMWAGSGDFEKLKMVGAGAVGLVFVLFFLRHIWVVGLLISFCMFYQMGFGFTMGEMELSLAAAGIFFAMTWWRKKKMERPPSLESSSFKVLNTLAILWLVYVFGHTVFNIYDPYRPSEFALKNLLKNVEGWTGAVLLMAYFGNRPQYLVVQKNFPVRIVWCLAIGLTINIGIQVFKEIFMGGVPVEDDPDDPMGMANFVTVPLLNLMENPYALRAVPPIALLFCGAIIVTRWFKEQPLKTRRLYYFVMAESLFGSILSGGRATVIFVLTLFAVFLIIQRRIGLLIGLFSMAALLIGTANLLPGVVKSAPSGVRRALNWALIEKDSEMSDLINDSSNWRLTLFRRALDEWRSDPRIYWFGRATYSYGMDDVIAMQISGNQEATVESALRRGATHNMITDLLVTYGLCGLVLFFGLYFAFLYFLWALYRNRQLDELARALALVMLISLTSAFAYGVLGGGNIPVPQAWFYLILIAYLYGQHAEAVRSTESTRIEPPKDRRFTPRRPGGALPAGA